LWICTGRSSLTGVGNRLSMHIQQPIVCRKFLHRLSWRSISFRRSERRVHFEHGFWTITRNKLRDHFRRNSRSPSATGGSIAMNLMQQTVDPSSIPDDEPTGDLQLQQLTSRALSQVQSEFEARTWKAFWRSVVDGVATSLVASELNMTEATVWKSRSRILRRLRQQLGDMM